jgi:hypothetical protein
MLKMVAEEEQCIIKPHSPVIALLDTKIRKIVANVH